MVPLVKFLCLGKKSYEQKRRGRYFAQNQFFLRYCCITKMAITTTNCLEYLLELEGKLEFVWDNIFSEL